MGGGSKSTGEGFSRTTPGFTDELGAVLRASMEGKSGYSKQDAVADTQGLMRQQATNALQEAMPKIAGMQNSAGAYGSTTKALLQNDLQARIMGQLAATQSQAIKDYAAIDADRIRAAAAATQASTASYSETFENASSRKGWGSLFEPGGIGSAIVGGGLDAVSGGTKELKIGGSFADGGRVPKGADPQQEFLDQIIERLGLSKAAEAVDPSRRKLSEMPAINPPKHPDEKMGIEIEKLNARPKPKLVVQNGQDDKDDPLFTLLSTI